MTLSARRVVTALVALSVARAIAVASNVVLVPLFLLSWSPQRYGEWLALSSLVGYLATLDFGMNMAAANRLTQAYAQGDFDGYRRSQTTALFFYLVVAAAGSLVLLALVNVLPLADMLGLQYTTGSEAATVAWLVGLVFLWSMPSGLLTAVYRTTGDVARSQWAANVSQIVTLALVAAVLLHGGGLLAVALAQLAVLAAITAWVLWDVRARDRRLAPAIGRPDWPVLRTLARAGALFVLVMLANAISVQGSVLVLSTALGGVAVATFVAARTMANAVRQVVGAVVNAIWPDITRLDTLGQLRQLRRLHFVLIVGSSTLCAGLAAGLWFAGADLFALWTLGALTPDAWLIRLLLIATVLQSPWLVSLVFTVATNRHRRLAVCWMVASTLGLAVAAALVRHVGTWAVPIGIIVGEGLACYHFVVKDTCRVLDEEYRPFATRVWAGLAAVATASLAVGWIVDSLVAGPVLVRSAVLGTCTIGAAGVVAWSFWLGAEERAVLRHRLRPSAAVVAAKA
jgi:O-antigen/teichoic acid export membrane protein